jgi:hypothetical protein
VATSRNVVSNRRFSVDTGMFSSFALLEEAAVALTHGIAGRSGFMECVEAGADVSEWINSQEDGVCSVPLELTQETVDALGAHIEGMLPRTELVLEAKPL